MTELIKLSDTQSISLPDVLENLKEEASKRRKKKTAKAHLKKVEVGGGKSVDVVDRAEYQRWLDENFPGWSITETRFWSDSISTKDGGNIPVLFSCQLTLHVIEKAGAARKIVGVGSAPVNRSEIVRDTTTLLRHKYSIAYTQALKVACGWLGAFFDLRADEEERMNASMLPSPEQNTVFAELLESFPTPHHSTIRDMWGKQNRKSAEDFLQQMRDKIASMNKLKEETDARPANS